MDPRIETFVLKCPHHISGEREARREHQNEIAKGAEVYFKCAHNECFFGGCIVGISTLCLNLKDKISLNTLMNNTIRKFFGNVKVPKLLN